MCEAEIPHNVANFYAKRKKIINVSATKNYFSPSRGINKSFRTLSCGARSGIVNCWSHDCRVLDFVRAINMIFDKNPNAIKKRYLKFTFHCKCANNHNVGTNCDNMIQLEWMWRDEYMHISFWIIHRASFLLQKISRCRKLISHARLNIVCRCWN